MVKKGSKAKSRKRKAKWKTAELEALAAEQEKLFKQAKGEHGGSEK